MQIENRDDGGATREIEIDTAMCLNYVRKYEPSLSAVAEVSVAN